MLVTFNPTSCSNFSLIALNFPSWYYIAYWEDIANTNFKYTTTITYVRYLRFITHVMTGFSFLLFSFFLFLFLFWFYSLFLLLQEIILCRSFPFRTWKKYNYSICYSILCYLKTSFLGTVMHKLFFSLPFAFHLRKDGFIFIAREYPTILNDFQCNMFYFIRWFMFIIEMTYIK